MYIVKVLENKELNVNSIAKLYLTTAADGTQYKVNGWILRYSSKSFKSLFLRCICSLLMFPSLKVNPQFL